MDRQKFSKRIIQKTQGNKKKKTFETKSSKTETNKCMHDIPSISSATTLQKNYINVKLNDFPIKALVDSGADLCCINKSLLTKLGLTNYEQTKTTQVRGVSGKIIQVLGTIKLNISIGESQFIQNFHIFDNIHHSLIIGHDFLHQNKCKLDYEKQEFQAGIANVHILTTFSTGLARLQYSVVLKPLSETLVPVRLSRIQNNEVALIEPVQSLLKKHVTIARTVVKSNNGKAACKIMNPYPFEVFLCSNVVVGKLSPIDESSVREFEESGDSADVDEGCEETIADICSLTEVEIDDILSKLGISVNNSDLSPSQTNKLRLFIAKNADLFASDTSELGCTKLHSHKIETGDAPPQRQNPYRTSPNMKAEIESHTKDLLDNDLIEPSNSMWAAPVIMCKKKDGTFRMAVDYRKLNAVTTPINFPLPRFEDVVDSFAENQSKIFSVLDLRSGFHQIPLDPETKHKTTFVTHEGCFNYKRLPYGLRNAPIAFQTVMAQVLRGINFKFTLVYVDDILVHSSDFDTHLKHLQIVFDRLRDANLKLQPKKCKFAADQVEYLGHFFSKQGISSNPEKIEKVKSFPRPKTQKDVRSFIGLCNYYRKFIFNFSAILKPLNNLLKKETKFAWTNDCEEAFLMLKDKLTTSPVLVYPNMTKPFILSTDASDTAIGFVLGQLDDEKRERVIAYGGRSIRNAEQNWPIHEKECLALVEAITQFRPYLANAQFTVYTDNICTKYLHKWKDLKDRRGRWVMKLQGYDFSIIHKPGIKNGNADALSRRTYENPNADKVSDQNVLPEQNIVDSLNVDDSSSLVHPLIAAMDSCNEDLSENVHSVYIADLVD